MEMLEKKMWEPIKWSHHGGWNTYIQIESGQTSISMDVAIFGRKDLFYFRAEERIIEPTNICQYIIKIEQDNKQ